MPKPKKSKDERVQKFLDDVMMHDDEKFNIMEALRKIVFANHGKTNERMMYGGIMFSMKGDKKDTAKKDVDFGGIFVRKHHVSFEFGNGFAFDDPKKLLEGTGKFRRHLKIKSIADVKDKDVDFFVKQAV